MMFTTSPPRAVSYYLTDMSALLPFVVLMTLPASMYASALPSRCHATRVDSTAQRAVPASRSS